MIRNTTKSWGSVARAFHWIIGLTILGMLAYGWWMNHIPARPDRFFYRSIHADIGYMLLVAMVLRIIWRAVNPTPALPMETPRWQRIAAHVSHGALYLGYLHRDLAGLGAFRRARAGRLRQLLRAVSRAAVHFARQGGRRLL